MKRSFWVQTGCKMHPNCTQFRGILFAKSSRKSFGMYGGDDGARTRDLCRDRQHSNLIPGKI